MGQTVMHRRIRERLMSAQDVIKVRISRDGDVSVYTLADRGDGGEVPWWQYRGNIRQIDFLPSVGLD